MRPLPDVAAVRSWQLRIARHATSAARWATRTRQLTALAADRTAADLQDQVADFAYWSSFTARHPGVVEPRLLTEYVAQLARLATNLGRGAESAGSVLKALDDAIAAQTAAGGPVTRLHLAKATFLRTESAESAARLAALRAAAASTGPGTEDWGEAMIARCWYEVDVSHYRRAVQLARRLREVLPAARFGGRYDCAALAWEGVARFTSFQDLGLAEERLRGACRYEERAACDAEIAGWVAMAYHYRARIAEVRRQYRTSAHLYLAGQAVAARGRESLHADMFEHLRLAEPLLAAGLFRPARDHLDEAYALVRLFSDQGAARLQVDLGYATLDAATGELARAVRTVEEARRRARSMGFWRGELLCQGYLLALALRQRALRRLPGLAAGILVSAVSGELRRNNLAKLLLRLPVLLPIAVRRTSAHRPGAAPAEILTACPCQRHAAESAADGVQRP